MTFADTISASDLKLQLIDKLDKTGLKDRLRSQLRAKLYAEISLKTIARIGDESGPSGLLLRVLDSLLIEYFNDRKMEFTLSVFVPESGVGSLDKALNRKDIKHALRLNRDFGEESMGDNPKSLLITLVDHFTGINERKKIDQHSQTNLDVGDLMHMQITGVGSEFRERDKEYDRQKILALEERLKIFQRELEEQNEHRLAAQVDKFKEIEISRMRLEERKKYQQDFDLQKSKYEQQLIDMESKNMSLIHDERIRLNEREKEIERINLQLKQELLDESNKTVFKERQARVETELQAKQLEFERNKLQKKYEELKSQMADLDNFKERYAIKMEEAITQSKIELNKEYSTLLSKVEIEKTKLEGEQNFLKAKEAAVEEAMKKIHNTESSIAHYQAQLREALENLEVAKNSRNEAVLKCKELELQLLSQKGAASVEFEIETLKRQLLEAQKASELRQIEHEQFLKQNIIPNEATKLELQNAKSSEQKWKKKCKELVERLDAEFAHSDELSKLYNEARLRNKELESEIADLRMVLQESQSALESKQAKGSEMFPSQFVETEYLDDDNDRLRNIYANLSIHNEGEYQFSNSRKLPLPEYYEDDIELNFPDLLKDMREPPSPTDLGFSRTQTQLDNVRGNAESTIKMLQRLAKREEIEWEIPKSNVKAAPIGEVSEEPSIFREKDTEHEELELDIRYNQLKNQNFESIMNEEAPAGLLAQNLEPSFTQTPTVIKTSPKPRTEENITIPSSAQPDPSHPQQVSMMNGETPPSLPAKISETSFEPRDIPPTVNNPSLNPVTEENTIKPYAPQPEQQETNSKEPELTDIERIRIEKKIEIEKKEAEEEKELGDLKALEKDPILSKYMEKIKEQRADSKQPVEEEHSAELNFGGGDTADEFSAPETQESSNPSW